MKKVLATCLFAMLSLSACAAEVSETLQKNPKQKLENPSVQETINNVSAAVNKNWFFTKKVLAPVVVRVQMNKGAITELKVTQSSGNKEFDNSLLRAIRKTEPLPIPAEKLDEFRDFEFVFVFPGQEGDMPKPQAFPNKE